MVMLDLGSMAPLPFDLFDFLIRPKQNNSCVRYHDQKKIGTFFNFEILF